jgi:hypothetical protein
LRTRKNDHNVQLSILRPAQPEFSLIVRDKDQACGLSVSGNSQIIVGNHLALAFQDCAYLAVCGPDQFYRAFFARVVPKIAHTEQKTQKTGSALRPAGY